MKKTILVIFSLIAMTLGISAFGNMHEGMHQGDQKGKGDEHRHRPDFPEQVDPQAEDATQKLSLDDALLFMNSGLFKEHEEEKAPDPAKEEPASEPAKEEDKTANSINLAESIYKFFQSVSAKEDEQKAEEPEKTPPAEEEKTE